MYWPYTYAKARTDFEAQVTLSDHIKETDSSLDLEMNTEFAFVAYGSARWVDQAFPVVQLAGHKYAAALMATAVDTSIPIKPPWKSFLIEVPSGLLQTQGPVGIEDILYILVWSHESNLGDVWSVLAFSAEYMLYECGQPLSEMLDKPLETKLENVSAFDIPVESRDVKTIKLITRLVFNTIIAMSGDVKPIGKHPTGWTSGPGRGLKEPLYRTYRVGKPILLDVREELKRFLSGERRNPLSVQFLVRGHWRQQPCGPGMCQRKLTWIEPYWKGPEEAPIQVRKHVKK